MGSVRAIRNRVKRLEEDLRSATATASNHPVPKPSTLPSISTDNLATAANHPVPKPKVLRYSHVIRLATAPNQPVAKPLRANPQTRCRI